MASEKMEAAKKILNAVGSVCTKENIQTYILGTKKNGSPRAVYDIIKDQTNPGKKKKKSKDKSGKFSMYFETDGKKKKKKHKHKKKEKYWKF